MQIADPVESTVNLIDKAAHRIPVTYRANDLVATGFPKESPGLTKAIETGTILGESPLSQLTTFDVRTLYRSRENAVRIPALIISLFASHNAFGAGLEEHTLLVGRLERNYRL